MAFRFKFTKKEKLKSRKIINHIFEQGKSYKSFPCVFFYIDVNKYSESQDHASLSPFHFQLGVTCPKRNLRKAVDRNYVKRLLRESYRTQKNELFSDQGSYLLDRPFACMIVYIGKKKPKYSEIQRCTLKFLHHLKKKHLIQTTGFHSNNQDKESI